jgi:hypothetical protein
MVSPVGTPTQLPGSYSHPLARMGRERERIGRGTECSGTQEEEEKIELVP